MKFLSKFEHFHLRNCNWKCCLHKWWPFCPGGDELINTDAWPEEGDNTDMKYIAHDHMQESHWDRELLIYVYCLKAMPENTLQGSVFSRDVYQWNKVKILHDRVCCHVTIPISSIPLFSWFTHHFKKLLTCWISYSYLGDCCDFYNIQTWLNNLTY